MKREEINIRDPYILVYGGKYYLYGTRSATTWGKADGFDCYVSPDLENFEGPYEIFHRPEGFFADRAYWAPECYAVGGAFYLVTTLGSADRKKGIYVLRSDSPLGPFEVYSDCLTPADWTCIDGTLYFEDAVTYLIFSRSFEDLVTAGEYRMLRLSRDLSRPDPEGSDGEPVLLFTAEDAPWARPVPFAKAEFGIDGDVYFSDGPCVIRDEEGQLHMILSSWSDHGYAVGEAVSDTGKVTGPWRMTEKPLFPENGGHGMLFKDLNGKLVFTLHYPNDKYAERPVFYPVEICDGQLQLCE